MKETIENNILLAEFLNWRKNTVVSDGKGRYYDFFCPDGIEIVEEHEDCYCSDCGRSSTTKSYLYGEDLKFHTSWDWLMLVVDKIENSHPISVIISCSNCEVYNCETQETISHLEGVKIEATYNACIQFVKLFNSQNK